MVQYSVRPLEQFDSLSYKIVAIVCSFIGLFSLLCSTGVVLVILCSKKVSRISPTLNSPPCRGHYSTLSNLYNWSCWLQCRKGTNSTILRVYWLCRPLYVLGRASHNSLHHIQSYSPQYLWKKQVDKNSHHSCNCRVSLPPTLDLDPIHCGGIWHQGAMVWNSGAWPLLWGVSCRYLHAFCPLADPPLHLLPSFIHHLIYCCLHQSKEAHRTLGWAWFRSWGNCKKRTLQDIPRDQATPTFPNNLPPA